MVVPYRHVATLAALTADELSEMMLLTQRSEIALSEVYQPQGINVGINLGRPAGAGIADHVHCTSCRAGPATPTSCRSSGTSACCQRK